MSVARGARRSDAILERLLALHPKRIDLTLGRIERLLAALGNPQLSLPPVIHVAGTNGKGSTVAFLRAMLEADGRRVHVYTSPHLVRFHERIVLASRPIAEAKLARLLARCEEANDGAPITFFEITTAAALLAFAETPADALILEVGLGGRLDATNVIAEPAVSVITPVDLDHQEFLGPTLSAIAGEKAGILKRHRIAVIAPQQGEALGVIRTRADALGAPLRLWGEDYAAREEQGRLVYHDLYGLLDLPLPRLIGQHQIVNAAVAIMAAREFRPLVPSISAIESAMGRVTWPARLQRLTRGPLADLIPEGGELWLDGGHNPHAARALAHAMADLEERRPRPLHLVTGMLNTKDPAGFFAPFKGLARMVTTIAIPGEANALGSGALYDAARGAGLPASPADDVEDALLQIAARHRAAEDEEPAPRVLICGSLYLAGRVLSENG